MSTTIPPKPPSPQLSRAAAAALTQPPVLLWPFAQQRTFVKRVLAAGTFDALAPDDRAILVPVAATLTRDWNEDDHPRDNHGRFAPGGGGSGDSGGNSGDAASGQKDIATSDPNYRSGVNDSDVKAAAARLEDAAAAHEAAVTGDLTKLAAENGADMEGLDHRLKGDASLRRKIAGDMEERGTTVEQEEARIFDALRYTAVLDPEHYESGGQAMIDGLKEQGYTVARFRNTWGSEGYEGINAVFQTKDGYAFELQFHTPQSLSVKDTESHPLYEKLRLITDWHSPEAQHLQQQIASAWHAVVVPKGAHLLHRGMQQLVLDAINPQLVDHFAVTDLQGKTLSLLRVERDPTTGYVVQLTARSPQTAGWVDAKGQLETLYSDPAIVNVPPSAAAAWEDYCTRTQSTKAAHPVATASPLRHTRKPIPSPHDAPVAQAVTKGLQHDIAQLFQDVMKKGHAALTGKPLTKSGGVPQSLMDEAAAAYAIDDVNQQDLTDMLYAAMLQMYLQGYNDVTGQFGPPVASVPPAAQKRLQQEAVDAAAAIVNTHDEDIDNFLTTIGINNDTDSEENAAITADGIAFSIDDWLDDDIDWKSNLISATTVGYGLNQGAADSIAELADTERAADYLVVVTPTDGASCCDECKTWAGAYLPLGQADQFPDFPLHPNCTHATVVVPANTLV